jgi:subtilase family serine protease
MKKFTRIAAVAGLALGLLSTGHSASAKPFPADLVVANVVSYVGSDGAEMLRITVKNQGQGPSSWFNVGILGTGGTKLNEVKTFGGLAAGGQTSFSHSPGITTNCDYSRTISVDNTSVNAESNENNNIKTIGATYCPRPDLIIKTETVNPGGSLNEYQNVYITNVGTATAENVKVSMEGSGGQVSSSSMMVSPIEPGQTRSMSFLIGAQCDYTMKFTLDPQDTVDEYNETNNLGTAVDSCN